MRSPFAWCMRANLNLELDPLFSPCCMFLYSYVESMSRDDRHLGNSDALVVLWWNKGCRATLYSRMEFSILGILLLVHVSVHLFAE